MKRLLVLGAVLLAGVSTREVTRAQTQEPITATPTPIPSPTVTPTPTPAIDPTHFALSAWSYPGPAAVDVNRVESNAAANAEAAIVHFGTSFLDEGRLTGYYEEGLTPNIDAHGTAHPVITYYLVSTFATPTAAAAAFAQQKKGWDDAVTLPPAGATVSLLSSSGQQLGDQSSNGTYQATVKATTGDVIDQSELFEQRGIYLIEVFRENLHSDAGYATATRSTMQTIAATLDGVANGTIAGPAKPVYPSSIKFSILSTRFEGNGLALNVSKNLKLAPVTSVRAGSRVQASTYFVVNAAKPKTKFTVEFRLVREGSKTALDRKYTHPMNSYAPDYFRDDLHDVQLNTAGKYDLTIRVKVGKSTKSGTAHITVTGHASSLHALTARSTTPTEQIASQALPAATVLGAFGR